MVMWGEVVEKLMMWGQGEDDTKGRVSLITTIYIYIYVFFYIHNITYLH